MTHCRWHRGKSSEWKGFIQIYDPTRKSGAMQSGSLGRHAPGNSSPRLGREGEEISIRGYVQLTEVCLSCSTT